MTNTLPAEAPQHSELITHSLLVSEINQRYPQCRPVFEKYGIAGCGGENGPQEPLFIFAAAHRVPLRELVDELSHALRGEGEDERGTQKARGPVEVESETLYKRFVLGALFVALTAGFGLGLVNLTRIALAQSFYEISGVLKQIHGHAQVFGWVGLFIMGVAFHTVPRMKMRPLRYVRAAKWCFDLMFVGVFMRVFAQPLARQSLFAAALLISGLLELAAVGIFVWLLGSTVVRSERPTEPYEKFIWVSTGWFTILAIWNFWIVAQMFLKRSVGIPALQDALWIHAAFFGFIANMIFGFSLRVLPHFLGLRETKTWAANVAFVSWNAAVFLRYPVEQLAWTASVLEAIAIVLFVWSLGVFAGHRTKIDIKGVDNTFAWFVYLGYAWLLVAAAIPFHADVFRLSASARHTMALGFVTPLILGVSYRVLPIFNGVNLWSTRLMRVSFWHLAAGSTLAVSMAVNNVFETTWSYAWSGIAGYLVFAALVMFAVSIAMTLRTKAEKFTRESIVKLTTRVTELLEIHPSIRPVLIHGGLGGIGAMAHDPPPFVTIEFAARRHGIDPQPLLKLLNEEIQRRTQHESH